MNGFSTLEILITLLFSIYQNSHLKPHLSYLNSFIPTFYTQLILTLSQPQTILKILKNFLGWMNNTSNSQNTSSQSKLVYLHILFSFARKDYTIAGLLSVFAADFLDLIYLDNVIPPESPFAAIRLGIPNLKLLFKCCSKFHKL